MASAQRQRVRRPQRRLCFSLVTRTMKKLIEIAGEDGKKSHSFEQREIVVFGQIHNLGRTAATTAHGPGSGQDGNSADGGGSRVSDSGVAVIRHTCCGAAKRTTPVVEIPRGYILHQIRRKGNRPLMCRAAAASAAE